MDCAHSVLWQVGSACQRHTEGKEGSRGKHACRWKACQVVLVGGWRVQSRQGMLT